jgi:RNA polymerase subunit RPABC4/transcription elongation factor Spt4
MKARAYPVPNADAMQIATLIHADLSRDGFDVRIQPVPPPAFGLVVEVRRPNGMLQRSIGHAAVLKVWLLPNRDGIVVRVGTDRVGDSAASAVEWLLATPALVTEGYAAFQQAQIDERILRVADHWAVNVAGVPVNRTPAAVPTVGPCPTCRMAMPYGARFCPGCGHDTKAAAGVRAACPSCHGAVALDAVFCPLCGARVAAAPLATTTCVSCKAALEGDAVFCSGCGARQDANAASAEKTEERKVR